MCLAFVFTVVVVFTILWFSGLVPPTAGFSGFPREVENRAWGYSWSLLCTSFPAGIRGFWPYLFCTSTLLTNRLLDYGVRKTPDASEVMAI